MSGKTKRKIHINIFDVVVILLVVALIATLVFRIYSGAHKASRQSEAIYVLEFECDAEYNSILNYVNNGDAVYFESNGYLLGFLYADEGSEQGAMFGIVDDIPTFANETTSTSAETEDITEIPVEDVEESAADKPTYTKIKIGGKLTLNSEVTKAKNGSYYTIGDINITEGSVINVYTDSAEFTLNVINISILD